MKHIEYKLYPELTFIDVTEKVTYVRGLDLSPYAKLPLTKVPALILALAKHVEPSDRIKLIDKIKNL